MRFFSIVISTLGTEPNVLRETLSSIFSSDLTNYEVIVVDQNDHERVGTLMKEISKELFGRKNVTMKYISSKEKGLSRGRNEGIKRSEGEWFLFFDDEMSVPPDFGTRIFPVLERTKKKAFYGTILNREDGRHYLKKVILTRSLHIWNFDSASSIGILLYRSVFDDVGLFDVKFGVGSVFRGAEDLDMVLRLLGAGITIRYLREFVVYHPKAKHDAQKRFAYGFGLGALYRKHVGNSIGFSLVLGTKLLIEIGLKTALLLVFLPLQIQRSKLYFANLRGMFQGFLVYSHE